MFYLLITPPTVELGAAVRDDVIGTVIDRSRSILRLRDRQQRLLKQGDQRLGVARTIVELPHKLNLGEQVKENHLVSPLPTTWVATITPDEPWPRDQEKHQ